jgi:hypothetical protein
MRVKVKKFFNGSVSSSCRKSPILVFSCISTTVRCKNVNTTRVGVKKGFLYSVFRLFLIRRFLVDSCACCKYHFSFQVLIL